VNCIRNLFFLLLLAGFTACNRHMAASESLLPLQLQNAILNPEPENELKPLTAYPAQFPDHLQLKYSAALNTKPSHADNRNLYEFLENWMGTPYRFGGSDSTGIDCSRLMIQIYEEVYQQPLNGSAADFYLRSEPISEEELQEGDLVFFRIRRNMISHVGMFLANGYFIHASQHCGVVISSLHDPYYYHRFAGAGRMKSCSLIFSE
jgi:lipoprotein Spr